ncbi:GDSL esterase/lipase At1g29670-like [Rhododendron vialii]|uniref:GDSL esterase/lipase At1g29670-like n=1 Tax=Rhododendron vialii TaxID=182163 RepID=UPI00265F04EC|nr:GDSL esterase/lipase At1g29670-like [Rhododendron vialii]
MASNLKVWLMVSFILLPLVFGVPQVPCLFILGDSLFDNGNNNDLVTEAKANYPPYGIDFPQGPTGRFSNGKNMADFIAEFLGFGKPIPPFASTTATDDQEILMGVNYASGAAGIRDETGHQLGDRISLKRQLLNHQTIVSRIAFGLGSKEAAADYLSKCIYLVNIGSNDYINNYLMPQNYATSALYSPDQYADVLNQQYSKLLKILYNEGARKIALFGLGLIGCIPAEIANYGANGCVDTVNKDVQLFNNGLDSLVNDLNHDLADAQFIYINVTEISSGDPSVFGITVTNAPCCIVSTTIAKGQCAPNLVPCDNRSKYAFYDGFHPTQSAGELLAAGAYTYLPPLIL